MTGRSLAVFGAAVSMCTQCLFAQGRELSLRITRAVAILDSAQTERGMDSLRALLAEFPSDGAVELRVRANVHLAAASLSFGVQDSARAHLQEAVRLNPFAVLDPEVFNPDILTTFREVRRSTPSVGLRVAADTVVNPSADVYLVAVAVGAPGNVTVALVPASGAAPGPTATRLRVDSSSSFVLPLRAPDSLPLEPGDYRLAAEMPGTATYAATTILRITRQPVDTASHDPPINPALFRRETRPGPPVKASAIGGLVVGAAAAALPSLLANSDVSGKGVDVRAVSLGASIAVAGIAGVFVGRRPVPIMENVEYNRNLRGSWEERNRQITADNARLQRWAPLRIQVVPQ